MKNKLVFASTLIFFLSISLVNSTFSMGLRSFVALPIEKQGGVVRLSFEHNQDTNTDIIATNLAYGISANQTLFVGIPYRITPSGNDRQGDLSVLYRHISWKKDQQLGTSRLGLLGGGIIPTNNSRDAAMQAGFIYTHFYKRHEIDIDSLYQAGMGNRNDSGRYDISWQYRLLPNELPDWGIAQELYSVVELNGRWNEGNQITHQATLGIQWIHPKLVIEGGVVNDLNNNHETRYMLSTRFHF